LVKSEKDIKQYIDKNPEKAKLIAAGLGTALSAAIAAAVIKHKRRAKKKKC
jgi:Na+-transporting methylmalonyl-CoA/oxaloacetate decarboxylase gamma subunit